MLASGILFIVLGLPAVVLGVYYRKEAGRQAEKVERDKQKTRSKKSKRSKKDHGKDRDKDQPGKERGTSGGGSLIGGGLVFTLIGIAFLVAHFTR